MNYHKLYNELILAAKDAQRVKSKKYEYDSHHILPKSLGGTNDRTNLVLLTPREHYIAHKLLVKMYTGESQKKMVYALWWMTKSKKIVNGVRITSHDYEQARKMFVEANVNNDPIKKERFRKNHKAGIYKYDYSKISATLKSTLDKLSEAEMKERMIKSVALCDQKARADSIRKGKSSTLEITNIDGSKERIYSYETETLLGLSWSQVKYRVSAHNGLLNDGRRVIILKKYTGGNKWKKK